MSDFSPLAAFRSGTPRLGFRESIRRLIHCKFAASPGGGQAIVLDMASRMTQNKTKKLDANQPEAFIAYQLRVAEQLITKTFERQLRQAGVESSFASLAVLQVLADGRRLSGAELARASLVTPQTMNGVLRVMESQGLVLEGADPDSARRRLWSITKKGCATLSAAQAVLWPFLERMDAALGADKKVVMTALGALIAELQRPDAESDES